MKENKYLIFRQSTPNNPKKQKSLFPNKKCLKTKSYPIKYYNYMSLTKLPSPFINVFCRFRPINELEYLYSKVEGVKIKSSTNLLLKEKNTDKFSREYKFSEIFEQNIHVSSFYNKTCKNIINAVIQGYNGTIILFGDTDKYKAYILKEIIPQIIIQIYQNIPLSNIDDEIFKVELGMYEVYQSQIINLVKMKKILELNNNKDEENNKIIYVNCDNASDMEDAIRNGLNSINKENKDMKCDEVNLIIEIKIYRYDKSKNLLKSGKLELIKLENLEEEYLNKNLDSKKENQININTLINSLSSIIQDIENKKDYDNDKIIENNDKENKLISILKNCLGGNSYTNLILSCSKSEYNIDNTKNLFEISKNIQKIKNNPIINVKIMTDSDPFIEELLMNNINKISKLSPDNSNKIKNIYRIANNIN
jgi:kinesin family protein 5